MSPTRGRSLKCGLTSWAQPPGLAGDVLAVPGLAGGDALLAGGALLAEGASVRVSVRKTAESGFGCTRRAAVSWRANLPRCMRCTVIAEALRSDMLVALTEPFTLTEPLRRPRAYSTMSSISATLARSCSRSIHASTLTLYSLRLRVRSSPAIARRAWRVKGGEVGGVGGG